MFTNCPWKGSNFQNHLVKKIQPQNSFGFSLILFVVFHKISVFPFQEAIAYFPLVVLISGVFASGTVKALNKRLGSKVGEVVCC